MGVTIKEIAKQAGVSIATVSHVINKTRYVSPELMQKVERVIAANNYNKKIGDKLNDFRVGRQSEIALVLPNLMDTLYSQMSTLLSKIANKAGYLLCTYTSDGNLVKEKQLVSSIIQNKKNAGLLIWPLGEEYKNYKKLLLAEIPVVCVGAKIQTPDVNSVIFDNIRSIFLATNHLIKRGHERIILATEQNSGIKCDKYMDGYKKALQESKINCESNLIIGLDLTKKKVCNEKIAELLNDSKITGIVAVGNELTAHLVAHLRKLRISYPEKISIIGFGDDKWTKIANPALTVVKHDIKYVCETAINKLFEIIDGTSEGIIQKKSVMKIEINQSTQIIDRDFAGNAPVFADKLSLNEKEIQIIKESDFKVGISFHYTGNEWARLHEKAIRDTLGTYGVKVIAVTDAHFNPDLQATQLEGIKMQKPDIIICTPADDRITAKKLKEISATTKLIFIGNFPEDFSDSSYVSFVSVNERENGENIGNSIGAYFNEHGMKNVGFIAYANSFFATRQRDNAAEQVITEQFSDIKLVKKMHFDNIEGAYNVCKEMIHDNPQIQGLYVSWEKPALEVIRALEDMGRNDIAVFTSDMDIEIAYNMYHDLHVKAISAQRPYEQGVAVAMASANALIGKKTPKYICVSPFLVYKQNLSQAWQEILHTTVPEYMNDEK